MSIEHITPEGANIFEELGLSNSENLKLRAQLMLEVRRYIEENELTQEKAAQLLGTTQSRVRDVLLGRIDKCSLEKLVRLLGKVGRDVQITVGIDGA
jgi:predicted XRE-type DNA-binding protein